MHLISLQMKPGEKQAHYPIHHSLQLDQSTQANEVHTRNIAHGNCKTVDYCDYKSTDGLTVAEKNKLAQGCSTCSGPQARPSIPVTFYVQTIT
jgi:hypothetical protein